jgi:hypothetical protein
MASISATLARGSVALKVVEARLRKPLASLRLVFSPKLGKRLEFLTFTPYILNNLTFS